MTTEPIRVPCVMLIPIRNVAPCRWHVQSRRSAADYAAGGANQGLPAGNRQRSAMWLSTRRARPPPPPRAGRPAAGGGPAAGARRGRGRARGGGGGGGGAAGGGFFVW